MSAVSALDTPARRPLRPLRAVASVLAHVLRVLLLGWATLAIYYSNLPWPQVRLALAVAFAAFGVWALWISRSKIRALLFAAAYVFVVLWWFTIKPTHDREWRPEVAVMSRATIAGDRVRVTGVRNFDYRSVEDFTPRYEDREMLLSDLKGVDFYVSYWMPGPVAHTFLSFVFNNAPPLSVSIEARPEIGEGYSPIGSLFKQFELVYVVGDERDLVRVRTNFRGEDVYLYRTATSPEDARRLFLVYLERMNELADGAEFYHLLSNSCTINIVRYVRALGSSMPFDVRLYLNGWSDRFLYETGRLQGAGSFEELRSRAHINEAALRASEANFSADIRESALDQQTR